jgi:hypothetical protein
MARFDSCLMQLSLTLLLCLIDLKAEQQEGNNRVVSARHRIPPKRALKDHKLSLAPDVCFLSNASRMILFRNSRGDRNIGAPNSPVRMRAWHDRRLLPLMFNLIPFFLRSILSPLGRTFLFDRGDRSRQLTIPKRACVRGRRNRTVPRPAVHRRATANRLKQSAAMKAEGDHRNATSNFAPAGWEVNLTTSRLR